MPSPMESRLTLKFMALWWRVPVVTWLCTWPHAAVPDAHHADIDLDGHAVRGEGDQAGERPSSKSKPRWNVPLIGESAANLPCEPPKSSWMSVKMPKRFDSPKGM